MNVSVDIGFSNVKLYDDRGKTIISSHLGEPKVQMNSEDGIDDPTTLSISFDGVEYLVGERVAATGKQLPAFGMHRLTGGQEAKAVFYTALTKRFMEYGKYKDPIDVSIGIPAELLIGDEAAAKRNIASIQNWLVGKHSWEHKNKSYSTEVASALVRTQANGALGDLIHNLQGQQTKEAEFVQKGVGIISIGFNTVELSGAIYGKSATTMVGSSKDGVRSLLEKFKRKGQISNLDYEYRHGLLDKDELALYVKQWASSIINGVETRWDNMIHEIKRIFLVGGGSSDALPALRQHFGDIIITPDDPYISVARGLYKWAVRNGKKYN